MKKILISQRVVENDGYPETRDALDVRWATLLSRADLFPIVVPSHYPGFATRCEWDGLILTGGDDHPARDCAEKELLALAKQKGVPILGVCHGMQIMAEALSPCEGHVGSRHLLEVVEGSRYVSYLKQLCEVNSYHNLCVSALPRDFRVSARVGDVVEAIEHRSLPVFGCMWHPERQQLDEDIDFLRRFF